MKYTFTSLNMFWITLVLFVVCEAVDTNYYGEPCPLVKVGKPLILKDYMGKWFEAARSYIPFEYGSKCTKFEYHLSGSGKVEITISQKPSVHGVPSIIKSTAAPNGVPNTAQWTVEQSSYKDLVYKQQWIVGTDYKRWATEWSCINVPGGSNRHARILTREQNPLRSLVEAAKIRLNEKGLGTFNFRDTEQKNCPS